MDGVARRLQLLKHGKNLQDVAMFGSLKPAVMRQLAMKMQDVSFAAGPPHRPRPVFSPVPWNL